LPACMAVAPSGSTGRTRTLTSPGVDLLILDDAPLELAGRVAVRGKLLFDDDPVSRVRWEATTRKIYFDELPRITSAHREFAASVLGRHG
jgi:hypothetical protein